MAAINSAQVYKFMRDARIYPGTRARLSGWRAEMKRMIPPLRMHCGGGGRGVAGSAGSRRPPSAQTPIQPIAGAPLITTRPNAQHSRICRSTSWRSFILSTSHVASSSDRSLPINLYQSVKQSVTSRFCARFSDHRTYEDETTPHWRWVPYYIHI